MREETNRPVLGLVEDFIKTCAVATLASGGSAAWERRATRRSFTKGGRFRVWGTGIALLKPR